MADPFAQYIATEEPKKGSDPFAQYIDAKPAEEAPSASEPDPAAGGNPVANVLRSAFGIDPRARFSLSNLVGDQPLAPPTTALGAAQPTGQAPVGPAPDKLERDAGPFAQDWIAQGVIGGTLGAGAGAVAGPVLGRVLPAIAARAGTGAVEGAVASKSQGGSATTGALLGGALAGAGAAAPRVSRALGRLGEAAEESGVARAAARIEERVTSRTRAGLQKDVVDDLIREEPAIKKAAGSDKKLGAAVDKVKNDAGKELDRIYSKAPPEVDLAIPIQNLDRRIAELQAGDVEQRAIAKHLQSIRDELNDSLGARESVGARALRDEQSAYQRLGYAKNLAGDPEVGAKIAANREASKAVGDAVMEHVTGLDYEGARAAMAENPDGLAARLRKANDRYSAANRIEAAIEDRARRGKAQHGIVSKAVELGHAAKHSPTGAALSLAPSALKAVGRGAVDATARIAPAAAGALDAAGGAASSIAPIVPLVAPRGPDAVLEQLVARADSGDEDATAKLATLARAPIVAARIDALRRRRMP